MRKRYIIGGVILLAALGYLLYLSFGSSVSYYVTVSEFYEREAELTGASIRVAGHVSDEPIDWNAAQIELGFTIAEGSRSMPVIYHGAQPSGFQPGANILVEGIYGPEGVLQASQIILKCPSKYEAAVE